MDFMSDLNKTLLIHVIISSNMYKSASEDLKSKMLNKIVNDRNEFYKSMTLQGIHSVLLINKMYLKALYLWVKNNLIILDECELEIDDCQEENNYNQENEIQKEVIKKTVTWNNEQDIYTLEQRIKQLESFIYNKPT